MSSQIEVILLCILVKTENAGYICLARETTYFY